MYYCMSEKLYPGSLSCLFNARESKKSWRVISGSMLFFDDLISTCVGFGY